MVAELSRRAHRREVLTFRKNMNPQMILLYVLLCITVVGCDRVYVHPFYLHTVNNTVSCKEAEDQEHIRKTFPPEPIEFPITSGYEEGPRNNSGKDKNHAGVNDLRDPIYVLGARFYEELRKIRKDKNILLSPTLIYESLLSFYIGASGKTANKLQTFLGLDSSHSYPNCTFRINGHEVLSALSIIINRILQANTLHEFSFSKVTYLFPAPEVHILESFIRELDYLDKNNLFVRSVDFTNSTQAEEQINAFIESKSIHRSNPSLAEIPPETTLLFVTYARFKVFLKGALPLESFQEFWLNSETKIHVPMMSLCGNFQHKYDRNLNISVIKIPVSKDISLLLLQPLNSSDLSTTEAQYSLFPSQQWLQNLSPRQIHLTLPLVLLRRTYDLQELLEKFQLPDLLGKGANLKMLSDTDLTVGKIINHLDFDVIPGGEIPAEDNETMEKLRITIDKPFLLAAYEEKSNTLLYFGRVTDPLQR